MTLKKYASFTTRSWYYKMEITLKCDFLIIFASKKQENCLYLIKFIMYYVTSTDMHYKYRQHTFHHYYSMINVNKTHIYNSNYNNCCKIYFSFLCLINLNYYDIESVFTAIKFISDLQLIAVTYEFLSEALFAIGLTICFHNVYSKIAWELRISQKFYLHKVIILRIKYVRQNWLIEKNSERKFELDGIYKYIGGS